jgi:hypothetical protein
MILMGQKVAQDKHSRDETVEEVNKVIRDEIRKAFETVNMPTATMPPQQKKLEKGLIIQENEIEMTRESSKLHVEDAIRALKSNNTNEAIAQLTAHQQITGTDGSQTSKLFIDRAIRALKSNNTKEAITTLELAYGV